MNARTLALIAAFLRSFAETRRGGVNFSAWVLS
jgi:hypothetical protein